MRKITTMVIAFSAVAMMTACGNKAAQGSDKDSVATEQVAEEETSKEITGPVTVEIQNLTVDVPEGWYVQSPKDKSLDELKSKKDLTLDFKNGEEGKSSRFYHVFIQVFPYENNPTQQEYLDTYVKNHSGSQLQNDITIGGAKTTRYVKSTTVVGTDEVEEENCITATLPEKGFVAINTYGVQLKNEDVQKILNSIKLK